MPDVIHPAGLFGVLWQAVMGLAAVGSFTTLIIEAFMGYKGPNLRYFEFFLDLLFCANVYAVKHIMFFISIKIVFENAFTRFFRYMKCHWAYYSYQGGEMRYHPVKTWSRYIFHGPFFIDVAMMIPLEMVMAVAGSTDFFGYGKGHSWYYRFRHIILLLLALANFCQLSNGLY